MGDGSILDALEDVLVCYEQGEIFQRQNERQAVSRSTYIISNSCCHLGNNLMMGTGSLQCNESYDEN